MAKLFITLILLFGVVVIGIFYLGPAWSNYQTLRQDAESLRAISSEFDELIKNRDALIDAINSISKSDLDRIDRSLPRGPQTAEFLVILDKIAAENRIALKNIDLTPPSAPQAISPGQPRPATSPQTLKSSGSFQELPISLATVGSYEAFKNFLTSLEKNIRIIDLQNVSFGAPDQNNNINFSVKAKTYYQ